MSLFSFYTNKVASELKRLGFRIDEHMSLAEFQLVAAQLEGQCSVSGAASLFVGYFTEDWDAKEDLRRRAGRYGELITVSYKNRRGI